MNYFDLAQKRKLPAPDFIVGDGPHPYLRRWYVIPHNKWFNIYLHHFCRSDDDRAKHSHPWRFNLSVLLRGSYKEHMQQGCRVRRSPAFAFRWGEAFHRIELFQDANGVDIPVWTLFITGAKVREWFFACPKGLVHWQDFTARGKTGEIGRGCD